MQLHHNVVEPLDNNVQLAMEREDKNEATKSSNMVALYITWLYMFKLNENFISSESALIYFALIQQDWNDDT